MSRGFTVLELLVVVAVLAILAGMGVAHAGRDRERLQLLSAMRSLRIGLDRGRMAAERQRQSCGLSLTESGWQARLCRHHHTAGGRRW
jgi:prepilin-type N-terminal cleavage/methylation domain-containing protein